MLAWESGWASEVACDVARQVAGKAGDGELPDKFKTDAGMRARALRWVGQLDGDGRADRIRSCGFMELCFNPTTRQVGWRNRWCRDRACPGCAKRRANELRHQLRAHLQERRSDPVERAGTFMFVTLTQPKLGLRRESPGEAVTRLLAHWRRLTNRRPFKAGVQGYLRATEVTYSKRGYAGWHAHLHIVLELHRGLRRSDVERYIRSVWCEMVGGDSKAQNFQSLSAAKLGQVVKYITKPFELPDALAPTFFEDMKGRKLISGAGTWREYSKHERDYVAAPGWIPQSAHVAELVDAAGRRDRWTFRWLTTESGLKPVCPWRAPDHDEVVSEAVVDACEAWKALGSDCRPLTVRCKDPSKAARSVALDPGEAPAAEKLHPAQPGPVDLTHEHPSTETEPDHHRRGPRGADGRANQTGGDRRGGFTRGGAGEQGSPAEHGAARHRPPAQVSRRCHEGGAAQ